MRRRDYLKSGTASVAFLGGLAGCLGGGGGGDGNGNGEMTEPGTDTPSPTATPLQFPERDLTIQVPFGTGTGYDTYARLVGRYMPDYFPAGVNVTNVTGAGGTLLATQVYRAEPTGYEAMIFSQTDFVLKAMTRNSPYDVREFTYYPEITVNVGAIGVAPETGWTEWADLRQAIIDEEMVIGHTSIADPANIALYYYADSLEGVDPQTLIDNIIVYGDSASIIKAVQQGEVNTYPTNPTSLGNLAQEGIVTPIVEVSMESEPRNAAFPDTLATTDVPEDLGHQMTNLSALRRCFAGPPGVPEERADVIRDAMTQAIQDDRLLADAEEAGRPIIYSDAETAREAAISAHETWHELEDFVLSLLES